MQLPPTPNMIVSHIIRCILVKCLIARIQRWLCRAVVLYFWYSPRHQLCMAGPTDRNMYSTTDNYVGLWVSPCSFSIALAEVPSKYLQDYEHMRFVIGALWYSLSFLGSLQYPQSPILYVFRRATSVLCFISLPIVLVSDLQYILLDRIRYGNAPTCSGFPDQYLPVVLDLFRISDVAVRPIWHVSWSLLTLFLPATYPISWEPDVSARTLAVFWFIHSVYNQWPSFRVVRWSLQTS